LIVKSSAEERHMQKSRIGRTVCTAAALALVAAVPATATASAPKKPAPLKQAVFKATLSGSQVTTWEYHHVQGDDDGCDHDINGNGDQTIKFDVGRKFKITFTQPPKSNPDLLGTKGRPSVLTDQLYLTGNLKADRHGEETYGPINHATCPGDNGGADPGYVEPPSDCGVRHGTFRPKLYFFDNSPDQSDDELFVPLPGLKNHLTLDSWLYDWEKADGSGSDSELRNTYERCPWHLPNSYPDEAGHIYISGAKLSEKQLFNKKRGSIVVSGDHIQKRGGGESSGQTILAWNLRLTRVK
jgi:hypothetical protein